MENRTYAIKIADYIYWTYLKIIYKLNIMEKSKSTNADVGSSALDCIDFPLAYLLEQHRRVQIKAFINAEIDNFRCSPDDYWLLAEIEICKEMM